MYDDLRSAIEVLEKSGDLVRIPDEVDPRFEIAAALSLRPRGAALIFDRVKGYSTPVIGNILNTRRKFGITLGIGEKEVFPHIVHGLNHPIKPTLLSNAPCQEMLLPRVDLLRSLPITTCCAKEQNPYITAGVLTAKDPETGLGNVSMNRLQVMGPDRLLVGMAPSHHLFALLGKAESLGRRLPVAISIGHHPAVLVAANMYVDLGFDELEITGGILGASLPIVRAKTVDVDIPAMSEIVIEGEIDPRDMVEEGPFGEYSGIYESYGKSPLMRVTAVTCRKNPIFQVIVPGKHPEHILTGAMAIEATVFQAVRKAVPSLKEVVITEGGCGRLHAVLSIARAKPGEAKKAAFAVFANLNLAKGVVVVDDDIDPRDPVQVEWALATRMRADRDLFIVPGVKTDRSEPMEEFMTVAKMGIDATRPYDIPAGALEEADVPKEIKEAMAARLRGLILQREGK